MTLKIALSILTVYFCLVLVMKKLEKIGAIKGIQQGKAGPNSNRTFVAIFTLLPHPKTSSKSTPHLCDTSTIYTPIPHMDHAWG